jgi:hypothetical protein
MPPDTRRAGGPSLALGVALALALAVPTPAQWVTRDARWQLRGEWNWSLSRALPELYREFNGIDFGHAHLAETLLRSSAPEDVEQARLEILEFIATSPPVPPDEEAVAPTFVRLAWEAQRTFDWAHTLHRSLYDLFASDVADKDAAYRAIVDDYLAQPEAITRHALDHVGALWSFPESRSFRDRHAPSNAQIWAYHWLQAAVADVQLQGSAARQRDLLPRILERYRGWLREPPVEWRSMPMFHEVAPEFSGRYSEAAAIFDNLHMLHDNLDDVLARPDLFPTHAARRARILQLLDMYRHASHEPLARFPELHAGGAGAGQAGGHGEHAGRGTHAEAEGPRPPSAMQVLEGAAGDHEDHGQHGGHEHG